MDDINPELIKQIQAGDMDAFTTIVHRFERPIRAWVIARCPPGGDADDVAQRSFVEAFKNIERYEPGTDFRSWLFAIARYQLMAECTRLKRVADYHSRYAPLALEEELSRRASAPDDYVQTKLGFLDHCLHQLDAAARQLLDWRYRDEIPLEEMARRTGRSVGAIKKHLHLLRRKLHDCVSGKLADEGA